MQITLHYDLLSPFAHVALHRLGELPADVEIVPKPVLLGALLKHHGQLGPAEIPAKRDHTYRIACHLAERHGVPIRFPARHPFNPLTALRVLAGADAGLEIVKSAFDCIFVDGIAPDDEAGLAHFADKTGLDPALAQHDAAKAALRANTDTAIAAGVFGVPTFVPEIGGRPGPTFWGVDGFDMLLSWLKDPAMFARPPYADLDKVTVGVTRS